MCWHTYVDVRGGMQKHAPSSESRQPWLHALSAGQQLLAKSLLQHTGASGEEQCNVCPKWAHTSPPLAQHSPVPELPENGLHTQPEAAQPYEKSANTRARSSIRVVLHMHDVLVRHGVLQLEVLRVAPLQCALANRTELSCRQTAAADSTTVLP